MSWLLYGYGSPTVGIEMSLQREMYTIQCLDINFPLLRSFMFATAAKEMVIIIKGKYVKPQTQKCTAKQPRGPPLRYSRL